MCDDNISHVKYLNERGTICKLTIINRFCYKSILFHNQTPKFEQKSCLIFFRLHAAFKLMLFHTWSENLKTQSLLCSNQHRHFLIMLYMINEAFKSNTC